MKCTCGKELTQEELDNHCTSCGGNDHRWSDELQCMEPYPYPSVPWDEEKDGSASFDKVPDRLMHWQVHTQLSNQLPKPRNRKIAGYFVNCDKVLMGCKN